VSSGLSDPSGIVFVPEPLSAFWLAAGVAIACTRRWR
jgi:hypothetical protein